MSVTEVTSTGWFGRIGASIKGILFGIVLILGSIALLGWNESNAIKDIKANEQFASEVITVSSEAVDPANEGRLVHLSGPAKTTSMVKNQQFEIEENAVRLSWDAKIYQWVEEKETDTRKKVGGGEEKVTTYSYKKEWVSKPVDSSRFKEAGHENRGEKQFKSGSSQAESVTLGGFTLSPELISQMDWKDAYPLETLPETVEAMGSIQAGVFHTGDAGRPEIGDERVSFFITNPDDVSVAGIQTGESFTTFKAESGKTKLLLYRGILSAEEIVKAEKQKAKFLRWGLRAGGVFLMFIGFNLLFKPLSVLADVLPFLGSLVGFAGAAISFLLSVGIGAVVIAVAWISVRPMVGIPLLVVSVACFVMIIMRMVKGRKAASLAPPPPPGLA